MTQEKKPFWLVWGVGVGIPTDRHGGYMEAMREARRLAELHPGREFTVVRSISAFLQPVKLQETFFEGADHDRLDEGIPF
jgi:hypothetical protein